MRDVDVDTRGDGEGCNGANQRISWHYDTSGNNVTDGSDKTFYFGYDDQWRVIATFLESDTKPKESSLYHMAGLGGYGGANGGIGGYIDHVVMRDRDANTAWTTTTDNVREERRYMCQNWRADVSVVVTNAGKMVEWLKNSAYAVPIAMPAGNTDSDDDWDATDSSNITGGYDVRKDAELDGDVDANDVTQANSVTGSYQTLGRGVLSSAAVANRKGYAGYENDGNIVRFAHVRHRVLDSTLGRWTRRDPVGYVDGMSTYEYAQSRSVAANDPSGLDTLEIRCKRLVRLAAARHCYIKCTKADGTWHTYNLNNEGGQACRNKDDCWDECPSQGVNPDYPSTITVRTTTAPGLCECLENTYNDNTNQGQKKCGWKYDFDNCNSNWYTSAMEQCCTGTREKKPPDAEYWDCCCAKKCDGTEYGSFKCKQNPTQQYLCSGCGRPDEPCCLPCVAAR